MKFVHLTKKLVHTYLKNLCKKSASTVGVMGLQHDALSRDADVIQHTCLAGLKNCRYKRLIKIFLGFT